MAAAVHPAPAVPPRFTAGRVIAIVLGSLGALVGVALLIGGIAISVAHLTLRDADGYFMSSTERFTTTTAALTSQGLDMGSADGGAARATDAAPVRVRVRAARADGRPVFVGIAPKPDVDAYLRNVAHDEVLDVHTHPFSVGMLRRGGRGTPAPPARQAFWAASASGPGTQTAEWRVADGRWTVVVMNASGRPGVAADVSVGASAGWLVWVGLALLAAGLLSTAGGSAVVRAGLRTPASPGPGAGAPTISPAEVAPAEGAADAGSPAGDEPPPPYPVEVEARLDEPLSRGLWLVKWLLALPHWILLAFLWIAVAVLWIAALVAVVATGRYPRAIFDFNLGVLRWTWRVWSYACGTISTDRYPPFTLGAEEDYPATLDVPYPERLSRGRALVKWWLLAIPHYVVVGIFLGWWNAGTASGNDVAPPGLLTVFVVVAGAVLLFTGRYPRDLFALTVGICRWVLRVTAYVLLMRDEYPPFRLGR
jgi:uncharacterized protein DUF4389